MTTASTSLASPCPLQPPSVGSWTSVGCFAEAGRRRALTGPYYRSAASMTVEACAAFCEGFAYFGLGRARECFCGDELDAGAEIAEEGECGMVCSGDGCSYCGGRNRLSLYAAVVVADTPSSSSSPEEEEAEDSSPAVSRGAGSVAVAVDLPEGWEYYGCWVDAVDGRILGHQWTPNQANLTQESCVAHCAAEKGGGYYTVAGLEYYTECYCGKSILNGGKLASADSECSTPCGGDADQSCGGPGRMSVFSRGGAPAVLGPPVPAPSAGGGSWKYAGCAEDNVQDKRTFPWQLIIQDMTPDRCVDACREFGYAAAGIEYGVECYCGDAENMVTRGARFVEDESGECSMACPGNGTSICGGPARLTTYFWDGDEPLYGWDFPAAGAAAAGRYEFLVGGVVIPLMTSQAVNGKVTFLEKWGTGPPNSTGAYELDLSLVDDGLDRAWRTMHVRTDLFCSAGLTLPDKAGRQLTVGGWAGDATFGVRLYVPDGKPGVQGTNDWEEDVDALRLQNGRWYPSALGMANGSVLVVGGEDGSNGAPVPTVEVLPYTGSAPVYMDWLERTDPNNLYPFLCVLPSGGILVLYWNEARVLDETTLDTIRTLPNMPGAVNDPLAGRTYPLEGTAVLLPQRAPYDDPLTVLVCGGSTEGSANALDNCVSTRPDEQGAGWTLERMPSPRVMPCVAPLPDGTYLFLNGARHGVAGFGLATDPDLSALLYDPRRPVGARFSVLANTTVARMYHSEAVTLLDGRVLVSGSDPQDNVNPQEYRVEVFLPPYLLAGKPRPTFALENRDWSYGESVTLTLGSGTPQNGDVAVSLLGSVSSTHGNSMGARTLFPAVECSGGQQCTVTAPPGPHICPPGWYQFFVLDGDVPGVGVFVRIGGDPARLGDWPEGEAFTRPGV